MPSTQESPRQEEIEKLAYLLWEERGAPLGSPSARILSAASPRIHDRSRSQSARAPEHDW